MTTRTDPMKSFVSVMLATLVLEVIVVLLALPVVAKLGDGLATWQGVLVGVLALALLLTCGVLRRPWGRWVAAGLQVVMIACWFAMVALGILGLIFGLVWALLLWMRHDVARRMAQGTLPSQQAGKEAS
ncbi:DUF4233 domain-containing protein [Actinophytocola oryzae]|uniref:Uncharacterized protein DUF4233 n=1 Tax=Actinophytocola oryzae TaxID=502181 RepID=A0A4R7UU50_9PSEU|nr:DUF4233 domain-containing protein [Actinophytocola oryzae]TDV38709.1 uncharacterized protein DUF4233 [Actinophytocola oryzae]